METTTIFDPAFTPDSSFFKPDTTGTPEDKTKPTKNLTLKELENTFRSNRSTDVGGEPDWHSLISNAKDQREKWAVMAAKDTWKLNQKEQMFLQQQRAAEDRITSILATPAVKRNKAFYDELARTEPSAYWNVRTQRQKAADRQAQGLSFHNKKEVK